MHHLGALGIVAAIALVVTPIIAADPAQEPTFSRTASLVLGYASLALTLLTLAIGPLRVLRRKSNPRSTDVVRDMGIWAALTAVGHVVAAFQNHMGGVLTLYFFTSEEAISWQTLRREPFGIANHVGLIATAVILVLLATSNDMSMRKLGGRRWKTLQRSNYILALLLAAHTILYWEILEQDLRLRGIFGIILAIAVGLQLIGFLYLRTLGQHRSLRGRG